MIPSRIRKVLSTTQAYRVRALLMGGQACVFYGAAEFSRDTDLHVLAEPDNLERLRAALQELQADCIAVPPFRLEFLERGHAVHFRCHHPEAEQMRIDVMSKLRGVESFPELWERPATLTDEGGVSYELMSLEDLVKAKKTQSSKDWPMVRRLLEAHYLIHRGQGTPEQRQFWLRELRTPEFLIEAVRTWPDTTKQLLPQRPLLATAMAGTAAEIQEKLDTEEKAEKEKDRTYWEPLKRELERLRHSRQGSSE